MDFDFKKITVRLIQVVIILIPTGLFFYLLNIAIVPNGVFQTNRAVNESSPYIDQMLPDVRVEVPYQETDSDWVQKIVGDPAFFFVHPQRSFDTVEAEVRFKNTNTPIVELGVLAELTTDSYTLQPLQNLIIDNSNWSRLEEDGIILLQRNKKFDSIENFLNQVPERNQIATYHFGLSEPYRLAGYQPSSSEQIITVSLRGSHEFYTYIKNETLNFDFSFTDMNRQVGEDPVAILVINESGQPVAEVRAQDDGDTTDKEKGSSLRYLSLQTKDLSEGVYKIQIKTTDDIFFRLIKTTQQKITFINQVWFGDNVGYNDNPSSINFWTEGKNLKFVTRHATGTQTLIVGKGTVAITEPFFEYGFAPAESGVIKMLVPKAEDLLVRSDGHFAFSESQFFNPDPVRLTAETDLDRFGVNYIIAKYSPPKKDGEWWLAKINFDVSNVVFDEHTWKFALSLPTITQPDREFLLHSIDLKFIREPMTFKEIVEKIKNYVF